MKHLMILALLAASPVLAETDGAGPDPAPRPVVSEIVELQQDGATGYVGTVSARIEAVLGFPLLGTVAARPVDRGDQVVAGETLARIDPEDFEADLRAAEAGINVAGAQLRSARNARERADALFARSVGSQTRLEDAERALTAAQAQMEQAEATLAQAKDRLKDTALIAPHDGVITEVYAEPGTTLSAGEPVLQLAATDHLEIEIDVTEREVARLNPGMPFDVSLIAQPDITARATFDRVDPEAERSTRTRRVHLSLIDPPREFRLGALVGVRPAEDATSGVSLPYSAILSRGDAPAVWVVDRATDTVERRAVTLGARLGDEVRIADGLSPGEEVVIKGIHSLKDGQSVGPRVQK